VKPDPESHALAVRAQQINASRGPGMTFKCGRCGGHKQIVGRKYLGRVWCCKACVESGA